MATKRQSIHNTSGFNFRPSTSEIRGEQRGTKPTTSKASVQEIFTLMVLHGCKKSIFFDTNLKVGIYLGALFLISLIADVIAFPKGYLSRSDNVFNKYFVKFAWGWNLTLLLPFTLLTSYVYCCGLKDRIVKHHALRILIGTFFWWFWTTAFNYVEAVYGRCNVKGPEFSSKASCLGAGHIWNGFDVSGHSFILIYGSLMLIEETRCMINWDDIKEHLRLEEHYRVTKDTSQNTNPLRYLTQQQFNVLKFTYAKYTPYIRGLFFVITLFQILWDVMLVATILYYHVMIEKFIGGALAILTWYFTYRFWYALPNVTPKLPGDGVFRYIKKKPVVQQVPVARKRTGSLVNGSQVPMFMGMPLYTPNPEQTVEAAK